jgi:hypothetical protein
VIPDEIVAANAAMSAPVTGVEHWAHKGDVRLFLWEKFVGAPDGKPAVLFVHGSSMASQPTFDLTVPGRPDSSVMDWFARRGFVLVRRHGRLRAVRQEARHLLRQSSGADDPWRRRFRAQVRDVRRFLAYGISSGACVRRCCATASGVARLALMRCVECEARRRQQNGAQKLPDSEETPADRSNLLIQRDHPTGGGRRVVDAFADAIWPLDDSMPGTYIDNASSVVIRR